MRYFILAIALIFGLGNASNDQIQALVDDGNDPQAFQIAKQEAATGDTKAHEWLGWFYDQGRGVDADLEKAVYHYEIAVEGGHNYARWRIGVLIDQGRIDGTLERAVQLFRLAADDGFSSGMVSLAVMQATGRGTDIDYEASLANYMRAAEAGNSHGMHGVGVLFVLGQGVPADGKEAAAWFLVGAMLENEEAYNNFVRVTEGMSDAEMNAIASRASDIADGFGLDMEIAFEPDPPANQDED